MCMACTVNSETGMSIRMAVSPAHWQIFVEPLQDLQQANQAETESSMRAAALTKSLRM